MRRTWLFHVLISLCLIEHITAVSVDSQSLLGCGVITRPSRIYPYSPANYDGTSNTPSQCIQSCSSLSYIYASVSAGRLCFCGSITANTALLNLTTTSCQSTVCSGDSTLYCGDNDHELVYASLGVIDWASIVLNGGGSSMALQVNQNYQFNLNYHGAVEYINYLIDFGDGTTTGWFSGTLNTTTTIMHTFTKTGQFSMSLAARSLVGMKPLLSAMTVKVSDQISSSDISMTCPNATKTMTTVSCTFISVRGTGLTAQVNYNESMPLYSMANVPNAQYYTYGSSSVTSYPTIDSSVNLLTVNDIVILPQSTITVAGRIASIQFYSSGVGTVNIYLLRLVCTSPSIYCYDTNTCGNCLSPYSLQCSSNIYSTMTQSCANATLTQRYQQSIYSGVNFQIVAQWAVNTGGAGYQQIIANSTVNMMNRTVLVGDVLALKGQFIGKEISTDNTTDYRCINPTIASNAFTCSVGSLSSNSTTYRYLLQTTIIQAIQIAPITMYNSVGFFDVQGRITQNNVTSYSASAMLLVECNIDWVEIIGPSLGNINVMNSFIANIYPPNATVTIYMWFINGNNTFNSTTNMMTISFPQVGIYTIGCRAENLLSAKYNSTMVNIEDIILNLALHAGNITNVSTSMPLEIARFQLNMATGSDYTCRINYDTSQSTSRVYFYIFGYIPGSYVTNQYLQPGEYNVTCTCENTVSNASYSFIHYVQYPIVGLQLQEQGISKNRNFRLNFTITQGTAPKFRILVNGTQINYTYNARYNLVQTDELPAQSLSVIFKVEIYAWNYLSSSYVSDVFSIVSPIVNPQIRSSIGNTLFPGPILFEYTMYSGENINVVFYFGDTMFDDPITCHFAGNYIANVWNSCPDTNHTFVIPGTLTVIVAFTNEINTIYRYLTVTLSTSITPIEPVTILQIPSSKCVAPYVENRAIASFMIQSLSLTLKPASNAQVTIIPDSINQPTVTQGPFQLTMNYFASPAASSNGLNVVYKLPGAYTAIFKVSNNIDSANISCVVQVIPILQNIYYSISPLNWALHSLTPLQASIYVADPNPGPVTLTWDFGDGTIVSRARTVYFIRIIFFTATQQLQPDTTSHAYTSIGTYTLAISAQGPYNTVTKNFSIIVQYPVSTFFVNFTNIIGSPSLIVYSGTPTTISLNVNDQSLPSASNLSLFVDYNDTNLLATNSVIDVGLPYINSYRFLSSGIYLVNFTVYNYVSSVTQIIKVAINAPFNNYAFTVCYLLPTLTSSLSDTCNLTLNTGFYYIPKQSQLVVYVTWTNPSGVAESFDVFFKNASTMVFNQTLMLSQVANLSEISGVASGTPLFRLVIDLESNNLLLDGLYTLQVRANNPLFTAQYSLNIYILSMVAGLSIDDNDILVAPNVPKSFLAVYQNFSSLSCLYIQYSGNKSECYGDSVSCSSLASDLTPVLQSCPLPIQSFVYNNSSISFTHTFSTSNAWVYAYAWNYVTYTSARAFFPFPLSTFSCRLPKVQFDVYNPVMRWARRVQRSHAFSVVTRINLSCSGSLSNIKQWNILKCNTQTEQCYQTQALNQLVSQLPTAQTSEIYLTAQTLPIGTYLFNFTVSMSSRPNVLTSDYTYVQVVSSDIIVNLLMNGTLMITNGVAQSILFQPGAYSIDPDSNYFNAQNWTYEYYCRIYGQASYPMFNGQEISIDSTLVDPVNPSCFDSPGNTSLFKYGPDTNQSILYIAPFALQSGLSYEFKTIITNIYDTSIQYAGYAVVQVQEDNSVEISVECVINMCIPDGEYQLINPTTQALVTSACVSGCENMTNADIQWSVYYGLQTGYPNNDVQWILFTNMSSFDNIFFYGRTRVNFTVTNELFLSYPTIKYWQFQSFYIVTTNNGVATGAGAIRFSINSPPENGTCTVSSTNGTSMTSFEFSCLNWSDPNGIGGYSFYAYTSIGSGRILIAFTTLSIVELYLPIGDPNNSYALQVFVEIHDIYDVIATYNLSTITVIPDDAAIMSFIALSQSSATLGTTNNYLERLLYSGNQNMASQLVLSLSQVLNLMYSRALDNATSENIPAQNLYVSGLLASNSNSITTNKSANASDAMRTFAAALNVDAYVRDYAVKFVTTLPITTAHSISLQASTMNYLTQATSALTRDAVASAASKCSDLVNVLSGMVYTVSYEDVKLAVEGITQLASNILVAVNTPLMGRGIALNLDYDSANRLPADYDTDLESPWSNPNLFADKNDFSLETIYKNRNLYYQQQSANEAMQQVENILTESANTLSVHMNIGQTNVIVTDSILMTTSKLTIENLDSLNISKVGGSIIRLPNLSYCSLLLDNDFCSNNTEITTNSVDIPLAGAGYNGRAYANVNMSRSVSLELLDSTGAAIPVTKLPQPIEIIIPRDPNLVIPPMTLENATGETRSTGANNNRLFSLYYVNVTSSIAGLTLSATFELQPDNLSTGYFVILSFDAIPILNSTLNTIYGYKLFCPKDQILTDSDGYLYSYFLDNIQTLNHEYAMFGIRELNASEYHSYCINYVNMSNSAILVKDEIVNFTSNYRLRSYTSACYYLDASLYWDTQNMLVGPQTSHTQTQCFTNHLTTFAGGWIVLPAPINWNYVFANADFSKNMTIYLTLIILAIFYIIFMIYARYKDRKDVEKLGVTPLPDNIRNDKYYYQILVFTGFRKDSGTSSKVHFVISGDDEETGVRTLEDPKRKVLQRGGIDSFIMAVPKSLGRLNYMRIWHDNSGRGNQASWFLKYIIVRDLQTMEKNHFICQEWFAVEKDDGAIDRLLPVAGDAQKADFTYLLSKKTYHSLSDGHLWFSVFSRPPSTRFTCTQRCTCCFVLLLMSMLMNVMYYDLSAQAKTVTAGAISAGPFFITPEQIGIGVIVELICFLPSTILVELFRRLRLRRTPVSPVRKALERIQNEHYEQQRQAALSNVHPQLSNYIINSDPILSKNELDRMRNTLASPLPDQKNSNTITEQKSKPKNGKQKITLPWWFIFIAYALSFFVVVTSGFFILARGIELGDDKTRKWLTSSITGFFSSILLTQPVKVLFMAIFFALFIRRDEDIMIDDDEYDLFLEGDEQYLHVFDDQSLLTFRTKSGHIPLGTGELAEARSKRLNELKMWEILLELFAYISFLWILYVVTYSNRDPNAYFLKRHLSRDFLDLGNATNNYKQIYSIDQYWNWLSTAFVSHIRASNWYNGDLPTNLSGYIDDKTNRILGWATMRQLRVKPDSCKTLSSFTSIIKSCQAAYSYFTEDKLSFDPGWTTIFNASSTYMGSYPASIRKAFMYNKSESLDTYPYTGEQGVYGGGGYVYEFRGTMNELLGNLSLLRELSWIDMRTRAVIIQISLYNPNMNLFIFVTILAEFSELGGVYPSARIEPLSLLNYFDGLGLFKFICAAIYMVFIIYYMQREIRSIISRRAHYFHDFWSYPEIGIIACSWAGLGIYIWRTRECARITTLFKETNGYAYVNLQLASYVDDILTFLLGFCCFFGTIKFLRLLRFNQRMSMLSSTLMYAAKDLLSFTCMFSIIYMGYLSLFFLLFYPKIWACSDLLKAAQMLFEMMLLKFNVSDLYAADTFLGPFCFTLFIIFVVFICMNMFISIIADAFRVVRHNMLLQTSEHEIVDFMTNQFKKWTGIGKTREMNRLHLNPLDGTNVHYHDPITTFPDKMDELIIALNKIYMDTNRNDTLTFRPLDSDMSGIVEETNATSNKANKYSEN
ncbi:unnamed protein product [Rotaria socialis]